MSTKKSPAALRATADEHVTYWRECFAREKSATAKYHEAGAKFPLQNRTDRSSENFLRQAFYELPALEAGHDAAQAEHHTALALDAAELAEGDSIAIERSAAKVHDDLIDLYAEEDRLVAELDRVRHRAAVRIGGALRADRDHRVRREAEGLPVSPPLPPFTLLVAGQQHRPYLKALAERVKNGVPVPSKKDQIESARRAQRLAAGIQVQREEAAEAKRKDVEWTRAERARVGSAELRDDAARKRAQFDANTANTKDLLDKGTKYLASLAGTVLP